MLPARNQIHIRSTNRIRNFLMLVAVLSFMSCESDREQTYRLLTGSDQPAKYACWNLVRVESPGNTRTFTKKFVLVFSSKGYGFEVLFYFARHGFQRMGSPCIVDTSPGPHLSKWSFGKYGELILDRDTAIVESVTEDTLILRNFPADGRAVYARKKDLSDVEL